MAAIVQKAVTMPEDTLTEARDRIKRLDPANIPDFLKHQERWTVFLLTGEIDQNTGKLKKEIRNCDGSAIIKGVPVKKGRFLDVMDVVRSDNFLCLPAFWIEETDRLLFVDVDTQDRSKWPDLNSFTEISVSGGFHGLCWYSGKELPCKAGLMELYQKNRWIALTGDVIDNRRDINDLTAEITDRFSIEITGSEKAFRVPAAAPQGERHNTLKSMVASMVAKHYSFQAILAACHAENRSTNRPPMPDAEVEKEVVSLYDWATKKQIRKEAEKEKHNDEKKNVVVLPGGVVTDEMKNILNLHHPNVAIAHCLNKRIGIEAPDGGSVRWNVDQQAWFVWNGSIWQKEIDGLSIIRHAEEFLFQAMADAARMQNESFLKHLLACQGIGNIRGAMGFLQGMTQVSDDAFNGDDNLFNVRNGTIDLTTGKLLPFNKENYITLQGAVLHNPEAICPKWEEHMRMVIPDEKTRLAFQVYMGYTLLAGNSENTALFLNGKGKNGKSVCTLTIAGIFGTYSLNAQASSFYIHKYDDAPRQDIARLKGPRFVTIPEGEQNKVLDEGLLKQITGGDVVTARFLYGREFDFIPKCKLIFFTNHLPKIRGRDSGIWRRIFPILFCQTIPKEKRILDYHKILITEEGAGILNWMLAGLTEYRRVGLVVSEAIKAAKDSYKAKEDVLAEFMEKYTITELPEDKIPRADLYAAYKLWSGGDPSGSQFSKAKFNALIEERVGEAVKSSGDWYWVGIRVLKDGETKPQKGIDAEW